MAKKDKWIEIAKKGKNFEIFLISLLATGVTAKKSKKENLNKFIASRWLQGRGNRYFLRKEYQEHKDRLIGFLKNDPKILIDTYNVYIDVLEKLYNSTDKIPKENFEDMDLVKYFNEWTFFIKEAIKYLYNYSLLSQDVSDIILAALKRNKASDVFSDFEILSQAEELSAIQQEKIDLLKIVANISKDNLALDSNKLNKYIKEHLKKYAFLGQYYFRGKPWEKHDVLIRIKNLLSNDWQTEKIKANYFLDNNKSTKKLLNKYVFSDYEKSIIILIKKISYTTNRYDEVHAYYFYKSRFFLDFVAHRIGVDYVEFIEMSYEEILDYLKNNKQASDDFRKELITREKDSVLLATFGKSKIVVGQEAKYLFEQEIGQEEFKEPQALKGNCASQGQARGRVVIFKSVKDIDKVKEGDIMVATATVPAFVPAMEKAVGIITEMGGLLSHAAIVSREMHLPCIVGVENITKILKTGDQVAMDATKGIIKVL